jgi:hypothetical protein
MKTFKYILIAIMILSFSNIATAQDEEITLTTYYPAPHGEYDAIVADRMAIGINGQVPATSGVLNLEPLTSSGTIPTAPGSGNLGDLYFDKDNDQIKYWVSDAGHGSSGWQQLASGSDFLKFKGIGSIAYPGTSVTYTNSNQTICLYSNDVEISRDSVILVQCDTDMNAPGAGDRWIWLGSFIQTKTNGQYTNQTIIARNLSSRNFTQANDSLFCSCMGFVQVTPGIYRLFASIRNESAMVLETLDLKYLILEK